MTNEGNSNARPQGLVSFLELTTLGRVSDQLVRTIQPTIDWETWIARAKLERWRLLFDAPTGVGDYRADFAPAPFTTVVPNTEAWVVTHYSLRITTPNGRAATFQPTIWTPVLGETFAQPWGVGPVVGSLQIDVGGTSIRNFHAYATSVPFYCPPQSEFGYSVCDWAGSAGSTSVVGNIEFYRVKL